MSAKTQGAASGAMSGAATGTAILPGWGTAIGAVAGGLMGMFGSEEEVEPPSPEELAQQTLAVQDIYQRGKTDLRGKYEAGYDALNLAQTGRAYEGLRGFGGQIAGDIGQQRNQLTSSDMDQFRSQSQGFQGAERLQQIMQQQAEEELRLNGRLSPEMQRDVDQMTMGQTMKQGRGAGAFNVGQLALSRQGAVQQRQDRARQFGSGVAQLGMQTSNPLQRFMGINAQTSGSILDRLRNAQDFGSKSTIDFDPISAQVSNVRGLGSAMESGRAQRSAASSQSMMGGALSTMGSMAGQYNWGGGGGFTNPINPSYAGAGNAVTGQQGPWRPTGSY